MASCVRESRVGGRAVIGSGTSMPGLGARREDWVRCIFPGASGIRWGQGRAWVVVER